ncbi:putative monovalent cation/H+ antiporter subunit G [Aeromicrobium marinum DSM 15272]|uniref:Monovalent cation/H+ antiporter subunit G n=1 Tax=Aeromicrobium marinum DSM 15272 TaxID=585531 RepID=E2SFZ3_9ACTN|nr:monovalent cation/H(+) antiporter subunit G [Aeromicrobium marinum]EFQ81940.1 putative monovalent cation/H+ antiporter subunit G [Aeromicrobium marinum DSM 15272]
MTWWEVLGQVWVVLGATIFVAAGIGVVRLPDAYTRASSVATAAGLGVAFVVAGSALLDPSPSTAVKVVIAIGLQLATSAVGGIAIARAAVLSGHRFGAGTDAGELGEHPGTD